MLPHSSEDLHSIPEGPSAYLAELETVVFLRDFGDKEAPLMLKRTPLCAAVMASAAVVAPCAPADEKKAFCEFPNHGDINKEILR